MGLLTGNSVDRIVKLNAGSSQASQRRLHRNPVIIAGGRLKLQGGIEDRKINTPIGFPLPVLVSKRPEKVGTSDFKPTKIVRVVDHSHLIRFGIGNNEGVGETTNRGLVTGHSGSTLAGRREFASSVLTPRSLIVGCCRVVKPTVPPEESELISLENARFLKKHGLGLCLATALLTVGGLCLTTPSTASAALAAQPTELIEFEYQQAGASEEEAVRLAAIRAIRATVVRCVHSDYSLQALDRVEPFIQQNWPKFTASTYVLERRTSREGFAVKVRVTTRPRALFDELRSLRFLHLPNRNPAHFVFLEEQVDGKPGDGLGRISLAKALADAGFRVMDEGIAQPSPSSDVAVDPLAMAAAREAATRLGADIIFTGRVDTRKTATGEVIYDNLVTYETRISIQQIQVSDGTALGSRSIAERATFKAADVARSESIRLASKAVAEDLGTAGRDLYERTVLDQVPASLLLTNVTPGELEMIASHIQSRLGAGTQTFVKLFYGNAAVLNIDTPKAYYELERAIQSFRSPSLRIVERAGKRVTVTSQQ